MIGPIGFILISLLTLEPQIVSVEIHPPVITVGDVVECVVRLHLPRGSRLLLARRLDPHSLRVWRGRRLRGGEDGLEIWEVRLRARFFRPGEHRWPPIKLIWMNPDGRAETMKLPSISVHVKSITANQNAMEGIRDIKRDVKGSGVAERFPLFVGIALMIAGISVISLSIFRSRRRETEALSPEERTLLRLAGVERGGMSDEKRVRELCFEVADALREYIEARFGIPAASLTSREVADQLRGKGLSEKLANELESLLYELDKARFSADTPSLERIRRLAQMSGNLIALISNGVHEKFIGNKRVR
ncbi:hypothetical protein J7M22_05365 [Candidatus Poribacteria bacterium]|nr:hypothetical protein [Candidatus Poribacteria bacterium]